MADGSEGPGVFGCLLRLVIAFTVAGALVAVHPILSVIAFVLIMAM